MLTAWEYEAQIGAAEHLLLRAWRDRSLDFWGESKWEASGRSREGWVDIQDANKIFQVAAACGHLRGAGAGPLSDLAVGDSVFPGSFIAF